MKEKSKNPAFQIPFLTAAVLLLSLLFSHPIDNDLWWILASGKDILTNGISNIEPLTMHEGLDFVAQQWLSSVIYASVYDVFGYIGIRLLVMVINCLVVFVFYKLLGEIAGSSSFIALFGAFGSYGIILIFGTSRPQLFTFILLMLEVICLEKYVKTNMAFYLIPLPFISLLEINLHAAMWLMLLVFGAPYVVEYLYNFIKTWGLRKKRFQALYMGEAPKTKAFYICTVKYLARTKFRLWPLMAAAFGVLAAGFINPYGVKAMLYLFSSYGVPAINENITEMLAPSLSNGVEILIIIGIIIALCLSKRKLPVRYICLAAGTLYLALSSAKGLAYVILFSVPVVAFGYSEISLPKLPPKMRIVPDKCAKAFTVAAVSFVLVIVSISHFAIADSESIEANECFGAREVLEYAESNYDINASSTIFADYNTGGYFEFKGYKPYIDARAEIFLAQNNHKYDYFMELMSLNNPYMIPRFLSLYNFEYLCVDNCSALSSYLQKTENCGYIKVFTGDTEETRPGVSDLYVREDIQAKGETP